ncbi:copper resistance protein CopC [Rothia uropygialis]|uniref:copper resistance protein CopC n=1 Tax=Kocuria sp. 36 TaxID=1415402 RepID=UPI00101D6759|nr:copper resistance protein CopC [Kocuria sp. 36]
MSLNVQSSRQRSWAVLIRALIAIFCGGVLALSTSTSPAAAHAALLETSPAENQVVKTAPATGELRFDEPVELIDGAIRLFPSSGDPQVLEAQTRDHSVIVDLPRDLPDGTYSLNYRVVSADGHPVGGAVTFHIGEETASTPGPTTPDAATTPTSTETAVTILTVMQYFGLLIFAGWLFFDTMIRRSPARPDQMTRRVARWSISLGVMASFLLIPVSALRITGQALTSISDLPSWGLGVRAAPMLLAIVALLAGSLALLLFCRRRRSKVSQRAAVIAAAVTVASPVLVGHSQTMEPVWLMSVADIGHLLAGSFWIGGVLGLVLTLRSMSPYRRGATGDVDAALAVVERFSRFALYSVVLLAASGTLMALLIFSEPNDIITTGYGRTLLIKLIIVAVTIAVAAWNRKRILPSIAAEPRSHERWRHLRQTLSYEAALLVAVIAVTGFLSNSSPGQQHQDQTRHEVAAGEAHVHTESQGLIVDGKIEPSVSGTNTFTFQLTYKGDVISGEGVEVSARLPKHQLGPLLTKPTLDSGTGKYTAQMTLPTSGDWEVQVSARVSEFEQPIVLVPVHIS